MMAEATNGTAVISEPIEPIEGGLTVEQIFSSIAELDGQKIRIRAKATKINQNILGKNWVTLQDGTGIAPDNKVTSTTTESVSVGDIFIVTGVIKKDVKLGFGYDFDFLLEEAKFSTDQ